MPNANFITQFEYKLNNLSGSETEAELLALKATADKYPTLAVSAVSFLDAAIDIDAENLTNTSTVRQLSTVGNAAAEVAKEANKKTLVMPVESGYSADIHFFYNAGNSYGLNSSAFPGAFRAAGQAGFNVGTAGIEIVSNLNGQEQSILDISGFGGILTHIASPGTSMAGDIITVTILIDGIDEYIFISEAFSVYRARLLIGGFSSTQNYIDGFTSNTLIMSLPIEAVLKGIGLPFNSSAKVTVTCSNPWNTSLAYRTAAVAYLPKPLLGVN